MIRIVISLAVLLGLSGLVNYLQFERGRAIKAQAAPLRQAAKDATRLAEEYRRALQECESEKVRVHEEGEREKAKAEQAKRDAATDQEDYDRRRVNAPADCDEIRKARVCPALMDY